ncbi:MAG: YhbY family RNA-binding protein [Pseudomonadales bacterium]|nr:YhbY family RNA-binding protein [Pseudomonadales bacterium]
MLSNSDRKRFKAIGHHLKPVVTVSGNGLSESVMQEIARALNDHELIKIKIIADREEKEALINEICESQGAEAIQKIGHVLLAYKAAAKPNPALSNILRANIL